jgi:hypothetical protein
MALASLRWQRRRLDGTALIGRLGAIDKHNQYDTIKENGSQISWTERHGAIFMSFCPKSKKHQSPEQAVSHSF